MVLRPDLNDFRLKVGEDYASREHLKEVETLLVMAINRLAEELDSLPERLAAVLSASKSK
ncbi:hypothetical protein [Labrenzia sp. CE80]|uniref:hypothetical protein n=1 Tax=Labrenzia sp. CE80 TaxID=1788986 RepID=UPI00129B668A|nr:hypothetical protein [Labrenzia sp. CE80]